MSVLRGGVSGRWAQRRGRQLAYPWCVANVREALLPKEEEKEELAEKTAVSKKGGRENTSRDRFLGKKTSRVERNWKRFR